MGFLSVLFWMIIIVIVCIVAFLGLKMAWDHRNDTYNYEHPEAKALHDLESKNSHDDPLKKTLGESSDSYEERRRKQRDEWRERQRRNRERREQ